MTNSFFQWLNFVLEYLLHWVHPRHLVNSISFYIAERHVTNDEFSTATNIKDFEGLRTWWSKFSLLQIPIFLYRCLLTLSRFWLVLCSLQFQLEESNVWWCFFVVVIIFFDKVAIWPSGFFHKRHVRKSARAITVECTYTCHKCQAGNRVKVAANHVKVTAKKGKAQSQKSTKVSTVSRILRSNASKKACKNKKQIQRQKTKKDTVVLPLRRSARRIQIVSVPTKKVGGRKKKKGRQIKPKKEISKKPKKCTWQKKRTEIFS